MAYDKDRIIELVLELNSLLIHRRSRFNYQYLPQVVDQLYKEVHSVVSEENEIDIEEIFNHLDRLKENNDVMITEMNNTMYASGNGLITIYYNFNPATDELLKAIDDQ